ncbi:MAG TPA: Fic family protein [Rhabdochlamydiaceae bacterium]|nr:Fic family protein [Rhabdochlamydiaceae bacterium]
MSKKKVSPQEIELVLQAVANFPQGAPLEKIRTALKAKLTRRTLQRRLTQLAKDNLLQVEGMTKARLYRLPVVKTSEMKAAIQLSSAAQSIQHHITQPVYLRTPVSYNREFLDKYQPNVTHYLPLTIRHHLFELGKSPVSERPAGTYARQIYSRILIDLSWNSSRLEGNTYSLLETERLLELGEAAEGKDRRETQMILNHKAAIKFLLESGVDAGINRYTVLNIHALLADDLLKDQSCGALRQIAVGIGGSVYMPLAVPQLISECFQQIIDTANAISDPFEQAFFLMVHLPYLQPFEDVNKRVSRLAANLPLMRDNLCPLSFVDVPEQIYINSLLAVYELNKLELLAEVFAWAYERSCLRYSTARKTLGDPDPFRIRYRILRKETVAFVVREQMDKKSAIAFLRLKAKNIVPNIDRMKFIEVVETELMNLHDGNISRYGLRPSEFEKWQQGWR